MDAKKEYLTHYLKPKIEGMLKEVNDNDEKYALLTEAIGDAERKLFREVSDYLKANATLEEISKDIDKYISRIIDEKVRYHFLEKLDTISFLYQVSNDYLEEDVEKPLDIESVIASISNPSVKDEILRVLKEYQNKLNAPIEYISRGESNKVFAIGNKIFKFGPINAISDIPYTLHNELTIPYHTHEGMPFQLSVQERLSQKCTSEDKLKEMYFALRDQGFLWRDIKEDNVMKRGDDLILIDPISVFRVKDIIKGSVLEEVMHDTNQALLELMWLERTDPTFNIDTIEQYFTNESNTTRLTIINLKDRFKRQKNGMGPSVDLKDYEEFFQSLETLLEDMSKRNSY